MYTDLREFDLAKEFMMETGTQDVKQFMTKQADWCKTTNDPTAAMYAILLLSIIRQFDLLLLISAMYISAGEYTKAIEIMGENGWIDK